VTFASGTNIVNAVIGTGATLHANDSLVGGSGNDTLSLSGNGALDLTTFNFSRFETVTMSANEALTLNGSNLTINGSAKGSDIFQFNSNFSSSYTLNNFVGSGPAHDSIKLDKALLSGTTQSAWLSANVTQAGHDVLVHDGNNTITIHGAT